MRSRFAGKSSPEFEELKDRGALHPVSETWDDYFDRWYSAHFSVDM